MAFKAHIVSVLQITQVTCVMSNVSVTSQNVLEIVQSFAVGYFNICDLEVRLAKITVTYRPKNTKILHPSQ